jgi:flagellar biosynthesis/type III secretory pathway chaperone
VNEQAGLTICSLLDSHITKLRELVDAAQREQQYLIAFEVQNLTLCTAQKRTLIAQLERSGLAIATELQSLMPSLGVQEPKDFTLAKFALHLHEDMRHELGSRTECVKALIASLNELQNMTLLHAERGVRFTRAYVNLLRSTNSQISSSGPGLYTVHGETRREAITCSTISRNA